MASKSNGFNKSSAIRELYKENPEFKVSEVVSTLAARGLKVTPGLVYLVKGKIKGEKTRRRKINRNATNLATSRGSRDAVKSIIKIKALAAEVGGYDHLKSLVECARARERAAVERHASRRCRNRATIWRAVPQPLVSPSRQSLMRTCQRQRNKIPFHSYLLCKWLMSDEDAFLQAILQAPNDHVLRLIFADFLEERDDPRGELLRLLHLLTQSIEVPRRKRLENRLRA